MRLPLLSLVPLMLACSVISPLATGEIEPTVLPSPEPAEVPTAQPTPPPTVAPLPPTPGVPAGFPDPGGYRWESVADGLVSPVDLQHAGDARLFVVEQAGTIRVVAAGQEAGLFLGIRDRVGSSGNEQGLLGLAFHPAFAKNGFLFVNYTDRGGDTVISRFTASGDTADPSSEKVILGYAQPYPNHNGGGIVFGPDGYLYIGSGDGGAAGDPQERAQNLETLLGKLLRIDIDTAEPYAIPADNPLAAGGGRPEIWASGLRNPWRFAFDPLTGDLFIGDVGQNRWEEVDHLPADSPGGANFGWDFLEGFEPFEGSPPAGLTDPVAVYSHGDGCSITGGVVVRDPALAEWSGVYLYGDYCSGLIWGLFRDGDGAWQNRLLFETDMRITSFGTGVDGGVYLVDRAGAVYRLSRAS